MMKYQIFIILFCINIFTCIISFFFYERNKQDVLITKRIHQRLSKSILGGASQWTQRKQNKEQKNNPPSPNAPAPQPG